MSRRWCVGTIRSTGQSRPTVSSRLPESTGVISELTEFVLEQAVSDCARLAAMGWKLCVAVNVSAADLADAGFADRVKACRLPDYEVDPRSLALEVTESAIIRSAATAVKVLEALRAHGIRLSIDDYGTGQSALSYLKELPVHELKIDKAFVSSMACDDSDRDHGPVDHRHGASARAWRWLPKGSRMPRRWPCCAHSAVISRKAISSARRSRSTTCRRG